MNKTEREIASQPAVWRRAVDLVDDIGGALPVHGERIAVVGCGTSLYMALAYVRRREQLGYGEGDAFTPADLPATRTYDRIVAISRSGTTSEVQRLLESRPAAPTVAITGVPSSPVGRAADALVDLAFADEESVVQTRYATTVLTLLRAHLGEDLGQAVCDAEKALAEPVPIDPATFNHFVFLGEGWTVGLAEEAALKLREATLSWTEAYSALEYRHGPISVASERTLVWSLGKVDGSVLEAATQTGATVISGPFDPLAELVRIHGLAMAIAASRGLDPDTPRHLSRSVILPVAAPAP